MTTVLKKKEIIHNLVLIKINKSYYEGMPARELYEFTRGFWNRTIKSVEVADYALAVVDGKVVEVYTIDNWIPAEKADNITRAYDPVKCSGRIAFNGHVAPEDIRKYYLDRDVRSLYVWGEANPVKLLLADGKRDITINNAVKPRSIIKSDNGYEVVCPKCGYVFIKADRCPECGQKIIYDGVVATKTRFTTLEEWADNVRIEGAATRDVTDFVREICKSDGFSYHIGTADLVLDVDINGNKTILLRFSGDSERFSFQPKSIINGLRAADLSDAAAYEFMEAVKIYLSEKQKNTPYERLNGYYNISYSTLVNHRKELLELLIDFGKIISSL